MSAIRFVLISATLLAVAPSGRADDQKALTALLAQPILGPREPMLQWQEYMDKKLPRLPQFKTVAEWEQYAGKLRKDILDNVFFKGEAARWRDAKTKVEYQETISGGPGYRIKKLRYEALPGMWIPALLYEPEKLDGKVPVSLTVNGHDKNGKAANYKQMRCINMAKRGMLVLNVEWFNMGQLRSAGFGHGRLNQIDLCGSSGLAPFYLAMSRGLDILLGLPNADPKRVAVSGLSGGGWQTITISSLDTRVTLSNPVAGYSSYRIRALHDKDLGDSEQTPCDLGVYGDYTHLTALMAPRPTLLTYNAKDDCCFEAGYALPPLLNAGGPIFKLYGKDDALRSHINKDPGTHNFEKDNRQALYRMLGDFFYPGDSGYKAEEIVSDKEIKTKDELAVELPAKNVDFQTLALGLAAKLPHQGPLPADKEAALAWQTAQRKKLREVLAAREFEVKAEEVDKVVKDGLTCIRRKLTVGQAWAIPVVELERGQSKATAILLNDAGRKADPITAERLLSQGYRVLAVDLTLFGEGTNPARDYLWAMMLATVGDRPLGLQASELAAVARWARKMFATDSVTVVAVGPRLSVGALAAAALEPDAIGKLDLLGARGSLKEIIEENRGVEQMPELFCFGLLEAFDLKHLAALAAPRPVTFREPSPRVKKEMAGLKEWYQVLGQAFDPLAAK